VGRGTNSLFMASQNGHEEVVAMLLNNKNLDVNMGSWYVGGYTPLHIAALNGHAGVVSALLETASVELNAALTDDGNAGVTPLFIAAQENRLQPGLDT
jgi:ankyrin repeat protein